MNYIFVQRPGAGRKMVRVHRIPHKRVWRVARNMQGAGWQRHAITKALSVSRRRLDAELDRGLA